MLWAYAMARLDVGRVTLSLYLVPAAAIVISLAWLGQVPGPVELAGGAIALAGVILASRAGAAPAAGRIRWHGRRSLNPDPFGERSDVRRVIRTAATASAAAGQASRTSRDSAGENRFVAGCRAVTWLRGFQQREPAEPAAPGAGSRPTMAGRTITRSSRRSRPRYAG